MKRKKWLVAVLALTGITMLWGAGASSGQSDKANERAGTKAQRLERLKMQQALPMQRRAAAARFKEMRAQVLGKALARGRRQPLPALDPLISPLVFWPLAGQDDFTAPRGPMAEAIAAAGVAAAPQIAAAVLAPGAVPHYYGPSPNYANSPMPRGVIQAINLVSAGSGYLTPEVVIEDAYGTGAGAAATAVLGAGGIIERVDVIAGGSNYSAPVAYIVDTSGLGTGADALAVIGGPFTGGLRKFVDRLALTQDFPLNEINQVMPLADPVENSRWPGSDYYEIELGVYDEQLHSDLGPTRLAGYRQANTTGPASQFHYLGPLIVAQRDRPVRIKFTNNMPTGLGGNLFIPVDTTLMGAGEAPNGGTYTQNRANIHLHGGDSPWISDGTPYQWTAPAGEVTPYPKGVSVYNVPDMDDPGRSAVQGVLTYFFPNQHGARLMFYHDHAVGITRLNVYAGEAAGYLLTDDVEKDLIDGGTRTGVNTTGQPLLPGLGVPLIIQDKTFVDPATIAAQDPTWNWGKTPGTPLLGDLWMPHVYMPNQNPADLSGMNAFGRWHYGPWFWPPTTQIAQGPIDNPYAPDPNAPWEAPTIPGTPNPSMAMEAFMDTPLVNGTVYPYLQVEAKLYRFRVLNACNDRFMNLQLYHADPATISADGRLLTEVKMVPAVLTPGYPAGWPIDGREGGVPDPAMKGPDWVQIGTEGGFLPAPVVVPAQPVDWNLNATNFNFGNVSSHSLLLGPAERADVLVDFTGLDGATLILYNDAPAAFPARDPRYDYYTYMVDQVSSGGTPPTQIGYGPNIRTVMQIQVGAAATPMTLNMAGLQEAFTQVAGGKPSVFTASQDPVIVPTAEYNAAYAASFPADQYARIFNQSLSFTTIDGTPLNIPLQPKAIQDEMGEAFDTVYGRMSGFLGVQLPAQAGVQQFTLYPYGSPPVEIIKAEMTPLAPAAGDGTQLWKITHNGVDTHTIHFHLFNVQLINRVAWDNAVGVPDANELGWKETIRVNPLEDTIIALRPTLPTLLWDLPNSIRPIDLSKPLGAVLEGGPFGFKDPSGLPVTITNHDVNWGWEYVLHCHLLGHEEMDMMHGQSIVVAPRAPSDLIAVDAGNNTVDLAWADNSLSETGFTVEESTDPAFATIVSSVSLGAGVTSYNDPSYDPTQLVYYRVFATNVVGDLATPGFPVMSAQSGYSNTATVGAATAPADPTNLTAQLQAGPAVLLTWTDNAANETGFILEKSTGGGAFVQIATPGPNAVSYTDTAVAAGIYSYRVIAVNGALQSAPSNTASITITAPAAPSNLTAQLQAGPAVLLTWLDNATDEAGFIVERAANGGAFTQIAAPGPNAVGYTDTAVAVGNTYAYQVIAVNGALQSLPSNTASITITAPAAPSNLTAQLQAGPAVLLTWLDNATDEAGFIVERAANGGAFAQIAAPGPRAGTGTVSLTDTAVTAGITYAYRVLAVRDPGPTLSPYSNTATILVPVPPVGAPSNVVANGIIQNRNSARIVVTWVDNATNETGFQIQIATNSAFTQGLVSGNAQRNATTFRSGNLRRGTAYYVRIRALNGTPSAWVNAAPFPVITP